MKSLYEASLMLHQVMNMWQITEVCEVLNSSEHQINSLKTSGTGIDNYHGFRSTSAYLPKSSIDRLSVCNRLVQNEFVSERFFKDFESKESSHPVNYVIRNEKRKMRNGMRNENYDFCLS